MLQGQGVVNGLKGNGKYGRSRSSPRCGAARRTRTRSCSRAASTRSSNPLYANGTLKKGPDQFVPGWDNQKAGTIFEQMLVKTSNKIDAVAAANDGLANAVVVALKAHKLKPIPLSGQDATTQGAQNIISGWQTMTVFKDVRLLAAEPAEAAIRIVKGTEAPTTGHVTTKGRAKEPAYLIPPQTITKANYKLLFTAGLPEEEATSAAASSRSTASTDARRDSTEAPQLGRLRRLLWYETRPRERANPSSSSAESPSRSARSRR